MPAEYGDNEPIPTPGDTIETGSYPNTKTQLQINRELSGMKEHEMPWWGK